MTQERNDADTNMIEHSAPILSALKQLASAAVLAPSGDNTQPWRLAINAKARRMVVSVDESRDPSPMNAGQRMSRIAIGAATENVVQTAHRNGWKTRVEISPQPPGSISIELLETGSGEPAIDPALSARVTNRRPYDGRAIMGDLIEKLDHACPATAGLRTLWFVERTQIETLASLIAQCDTFLFGEPELRNAFLENVRFDEPPTSAVSEGLSLGSLELAGPDRFAFRLMPRLPAWLLQMGRVARTFAKHTEKLARSASGLVVIAATDDSAETDFHVGQLMQRLWLALTREGLAVQPMMSFPVLDNVMRHGPDSLGASLEHKGFTATRQELQQRVPEIGAESRLAALLRFGFAPPPAGRTGRLPLDEILHVERDR